MSDAVASSGRKQLHPMSGLPVLDETSWLEVLRLAYDLFDDLKARGFDPPAMSLGGGTVLMLRFEHRLSRDIDLFAYDAQWLSVLTPRLNEAAGAIAVDYVEQANTLKIVTRKGDIDFIVAADVIHPAGRSSVTLAGRSLEVDATSEILAKKLFYRAAAFQPRDVYDMAAAMELDPAAAREAALAAASKRSALLTRLRSLASIAQSELMSTIIPYPNRSSFGDDMVEKVTAFIASTAVGGAR